MSCTNCHNTNFTTGSKTWSSSSNLHYGKWTPYGPDCKNTKENFYGCNGCGKNINNISSTSWTKAGNVTPRFLSNNVNTLKESYVNCAGPSATNYLPMNKTWEYQKQYTL